VHVGDVQMMNKDQKGCMGLGNAEHVISKKLKSSHNKVKEFNNRMSLNGLRQLIENLD